MSSLAVVSRLSDGPLVAGTINCGHLVAYYQRNPVLIVEELLKPTVDTGDGERYGFGWSLQPNRYGYESVYAQGERTIPSPCSR
jgi:hypothetical protein